MNVINIGKLKIICSLKCGSTFVNNIRYCLEKDNLLNSVTIKKNIFVLRAPFERIISYYLNKLINVKGKRKPLWHKNPIKIYESDFNNIHCFIDKKYKKLYNNYKFSDLSFENFLNIIFTINIDHLEEHLKPQKKSFNACELDEVDIIDLNSLSEVLIHYFKSQDIDIIPYLKNDYNSTKYNTNLDVYCGDWKLNDYMEKETPNKKINNYFNKEMLKKFNIYYKDDIDIFKKYIN